MGISTGAMNGSAGQQEDKRECCGRIWLTARAQELGTSNSIEHQGAKQSNPTETTRHVSSGIPWCSRRTSNTPAGGAFPATVVRADTKSRSPAAMGIIAFRRAREHASGPRCSWKAGLPEGRRSAPARPTPRGFTAGEADSHHLGCRRRWHQKLL